MAQLKNTVVSGNLRVTDTVLTDTVQTESIKAHSSSSATTFTTGTNGQVLTTDGTNVYWGDVATSDVNVTQTATTTNSDYEVLFSGTADNTTRTEGARKNTNLKFNPSTGNLQATQLNGVAIGASPKFTDTDTKVTAVGNHYTPSADANSAIAASASGTEGSYAINTEYSVVTGVNIQRDAKGHVTGATVTKQKIKDTNTTYESKAAASGGTDLSLVTTGEKATWNAKTSNTGTITKVGNTTSGAVTVSSSNNTASFGSAVTVGSVGGVDLKFTMPQAIASKLGTSTVGSNELPIYLNSGTPTAISKFPANKIYGGFNSIGNQSEFVGLGPAFNFNAYAIEQGAECHFYLDGVELIAANNNYAKSLFDGLSSCAAQPFDMGFQTTYVEYNSSHSYIVGELCWYRPSGATKNMWYRCKTACSGVLPTDTTKWEDVSASDAYAGIDPSKFTSFTIKVLNLPNVISYENGFSLYWRANSQKPNYVTVKKINTANESFTVVENFELVGSAQCIYLGSGGNTGTQKGLELIFTGFTGHTYWNFALSQIAFTGKNGSLEGSVLFRSGGTMFGDITPYSNNLASLGTSSLRWNNIYGNTITANSFVKSGGTSSQFLKADGSVDSNTYSTTDTKVTQTKTGSSNTSWRPLLLGYSYSDSNPFNPATVTNTTYAAHLGAFAPTTGLLKLVGLKRINTSGSDVTGSNTDVWNTNGGVTSLSSYYQKPSGGIPASDLASGVIPSAPGTLNTTATTAQATSASEALTGNITLHKIAKTGTYSDLIGAPALDTFVTAEEQGSDFPIIGDPSNYYTKAETDAIAELAKVTEDPESGFAPNVYYAIGSVAGNKTFTLDTSQEKTGIANIYYWTFTTSTPAPTITWPSQITKWYGSIPTIRALKHYEISILDGIAVCIEI